MNNQQQQENENGNYENGIREADFSGFGYREIRMASELLNAYLESPSEIQLDNVKVGFNPQSAAVFLYDDEYNTYMLNGKRLEQWFNCSDCGHEGFKEDFIPDNHASCDCKYCEGIAGVVKNEDESEEVEA
jgi:hypothetical protein